MLTDPIADMLTRIRNANTAGLRNVTMPGSKLKAEVARLLFEEGFIESSDVEYEGPRAMLTLNLKYGTDRERVIKGLRRVSKPGRRVYRGADELPRVQGGLGVAIVSTSQGLLVDREARRRRLGGEVLCEVW